MRGMCSRAPSERPRARPPHTQRRRHEAAELVAREDAPRVDVPPREDAALEGAADADEAAAVGRRPSMDKLGESS